MRAGRLAAFSLLLAAAGPATAAEDDAQGKPVREIRVEGLKRTKEYIVTRELRTEVGAPCDSSIFAAERQALEDLDVFSDIQVLATVDGDSVVVTYQLVESLRLLPSISIKIDEENGISAGAGLKTPNLLGRDIYASGRVLFGNAFTAEAVLENPWAWGNHFGYRGEYAHRNRSNKIADFEETANEFYLWVRGHWGARGRVGGSAELLDIASDRDGATLSPSNQDQVSRASVFLGWDSRDALTNTRRGWWNEIVTSREFKFLESESNFTQLDIDIRRYHALPGWDRHTAHFSSLTSLRTGTVGEHIAPWQLFGVGGTSTVRGWEFATQTGKNQFVNTFEYRVTALAPRPIRLPFGINYRLGVQLAAFGDVGIGWTENEEFAARNFLGGGGVGIRFLMPIVGMLRVDLGWGQSGTPRWHFGALEKAEVARKRVR